MTDFWAFDQPLDEKTPTSSAEERAKIAALFNKTDMAANEEVDYVAAFEKQQKTQAKPIVSMSKNQPHSNQSKKTNITNDYQQYLAAMVAQNKEEIANSQKKIEELHQLIDEKNKHNKKLEAISAAIDEL